MGTPTPLRRRAPVHPLRPRKEDFGPFYAYREPGESFEEWRERALGDIEAGQKTLDEHFPELGRLAFAPPYGSYGQDGTNDSRIPGSCSAG